MKSFVVWTDKNKGDFASVLSVKSGGRIIKGFNNRCDALIHALELNRTVDSGHYAVLIHDHEGYAPKALIKQRDKNKKVPMGIKLDRDLHAWLIAQPESIISLIEAGLIRLKDGQ